MKSDASPAGGEELTRGFQAAVLILVVGSSSPNTNLLVTLMSDRAIERSRQNVGLSWRTLSGFIVRIDW